MLTRSKTIREMTPAEEKRADKAEMDRRHKEDYAPLADVFYLDTKRKPLTFECGACGGQYPNCRCFEKEKGNKV